MRVSWARSWVSATFARLGRSKVPNVSFNLEPGTHGIHGCLFDPRGGQRLAGCQTLAGSFSAVWTATIARKGAFCSIFLDNLHDLNCFAPSVAVE